MAQKILLVEDDPCFGSVLKSYLELSDYEVTLCVNGNDGLEAFRKDKFDICLLDVMMPEMDGIETFNKLKEYWENNNETPAPVIALTANAVVGVKEMFSEKGFTDYISKPIDSSRLEDLIRKYLPDDKIVVLHK